MPKEAAKKLRKFTLSKWGRVVSGDETTADGMTSYQKRQERKTRHSVPDSMC